MGLMLLLRLEDFNVEDVVTLRPGWEELWLDSDGDVVLPAGGRGLHSAGLGQVSGQAGGSPSTPSTPTAAPALHQRSQTGPHHGLQVFPQAPQVRSALPASTAGHFTL